MSVRHLWSSENGTAKILFKAVVDKAPERNNLLRRPALGIDLHHRSPVDHRCGEVRAMMQRDGCDRAMLRKGDGGFRRDLCLWSRPVHDKDEGLARPLAPVDGCTPPPQLLRTGPRDRKIVVSESVCQCMYI